MIKPCLEVIQGEVFCWGIPLFLIENYQRRLQQNKLKNRRYLYSKDCYELKFDVRRCIMWDENIAKNH